MKATFQGSVIALKGWVMLRMQREAAFGWLPGAMSKFGVPSSPKGILLYVMFSPRSSQSMHACKFLTGQLVPRCMKSELEWDHGIQEEGASVLSPYHFLHLKWSWEAVWLVGACVCTVKVHKGFPIGKNSASPVLF